MSEKKTEKRNLIIEIARQMLEDKDYDEITMETLAQKAGVAKSLIFYHFSSKGGLYLEIFYNLAKEYYTDCCAEVEKQSEMDLNGFESLMMRLTDIYLHKYVSLIRLMVSLGEIYKECSKNYIVEVDNNISDLQYSLATKIAEKTDAFPVIEIAYLFDMQDFFITGYYRNMTNNFRYMQKANQVRFYEARSICEYRIARAFRCFLAGLHQEHKSQ